MSAWDMPKVVVLLVYNYVSEKNIPIESDQIFSCETLGPVMRLTRLS
jgi:hypothetical protein